MLEVYLVFWQKLKSQKIEIFFLAIFVSIKTNNELIN